MDDFIHRLLQDDPDFFDEFISSSNEPVCDAQHEHIDTNKSNLEGKGQKEAKTDQEIEEEEEEEFNTKDSIQKQKFVGERPTMFVNDFPEIDVNTVQINNEESNNQNITITVAPGENQVPTNIVHEDHWESKSYPGLFPNGQYDFHDKERFQAISMQHYLTNAL